MNSANAQVNKVVVASMISALVFVVGLSSFLLFSGLTSANVGGEDGKLGGDFTLQGLNGDVSLSDYEGKIVMVYFGFVNCKEVCTLSMGVIRNTLLRLTPEELDNVQVVLVSFDPERDSLEVLDEYSRKYHSKITGVTGTKKQLDKVIEEYGAYYRLTGIQLSEIEKIDLDYAFRHSSRYYIIDQDGNLVDAMRHSSTPNEILARIRTLI